MRARSRGLLLVSLFLISLLAGCLGTDDDLTDGATDDRTLPATAPFVDHLHDLSPVDENITVWNSLVDQFRTVVDGVELDTWIIRPDVEGPVPVVLEVTPYYGGGNPRFLFDTAGAVGGVAGDAVGRDPTRLTFFNAFTGALLDRGYAVGISSVRGTGNSEGCFTQGGPQEARDTAAVIEHIAAQDWSNGNVGLIGASYPGTTPQDVWVEAPPALKTIVPVAGISDMYKYNFVNGVPIDIQGFGFNTYYWALVGLGPAGLALGTQATDPTSVPAAVLGEACTDQVEVQEGGVSSTLDGNKDAYWQVRDFHAELQDSRDKDPERASVFYIHGFQDWNVKPHMMEDWLETVQDTGVPFKAWLGEWNHAFPQREDWWNTTIVAWFDQFLKDKDTGILDAPAVQVQDDDGTWRHEDHWPPTDVEELVYHPQGDGTLDRDGPAEGTMSYHDNQGELYDRKSPTASILDPYTMRGESPDRVVWRSEPLAADITVSGMPVFTGNVTATGERASLMLTLAEELDDGTVRTINYAAQSLNHVDGLESGDPDISGKTQTVTVNFFPQDDVVHAGSRIVLIAAGNLVREGPGPAMQPISDGSWITIDLGSVSLTLPVDKTLDVEDPQPCWKGQEAVDKGDRERACYVIR